MTALTLLGAGLALLAFLVGVQLGNVFDWALAGGGDWFDG